MIVWKFTLDAVEIDEPIGFSEIVFSIQRDEMWHGIFIEASTSQLGFYGSAFTILKAAKQSYGVDANIVFTASSKCENETEYTTAITGRLNFAQYEESCGNECIIRLSVERNNCSIVFKNRFDQNVNIDSNVAFDKQTLLTDYTGISTNIQLATQVVPISANAQVSLASDPFEYTDPTGYGNTQTSIRPIYERVTDNSIATGSLNDPIGIFNQRAQFTGEELSGDVTPQVLLEENADCITTEWNYTVRLKGTFKQTGGNGDWFRLVFGYWNGVGNIIDNIVPIDPIVYRYTPFNGVVIAFDTTFTGTVLLPDSVGVYALIQNQVTGTGITHGREVIFAPETSFLLYNDRQCPPSSCKSYLINETLSRLTEAITDRCLTVYSEYYGRTDSQPYNFVADGCGGLRMLTSGLNIRQAVGKEYFLTMQDVMQGLRAIDNIGMGMEANTETNIGEWLRIEPVQHFYQDVKILDVVSVPNSRLSIDERLIYSNIRTGYNKWAIESTKGIDEFCSYKERRTGIKAVNNELDISTDLVASNYIIENLRTSILAVSGQKDNSYDNENFIICLDRQASYYAVFSAATNSVTFITSGTGAEFIVFSITIAGTVSNNGVRTILTSSISTSALGVVTMLINFTGGTTVNETAGNTSFPGIVPTGFFVEQGVTDNAVNFYSPATAYNWRIRPLYNVMRWFKSIAQCYVNLANTTSKIFFTSAEGNYLAQGQLPAGDVCKLENKVLAEKADIHKDDFISTDWMPIYKPEIVKFDYPLSIAGYMAIKANPYGYINLQCGDDEFEKAYIKNIEYKPAEGMATFELIKKWQ